VGSRAASPGPITHWRGWLLPAPAWSARRLSPQEITDPTACTACVSPYRRHASASVASDFLCGHAVAITPVGSLGLVASRGVTPSFPATAAFPVSVAGRLPHDPFRGLLSVHSRYGLPARGIAKRSFPSRAPAASLTPPPLRLLPAGATELPGGICTRWRSALFHGAHRKPA
jgi:hypothetical protein